MWKRMTKTDSLSLCLFLPESSRSTSGGLHTIWHQNADLVNKSFNLPSEFVEMVECERGMSRHVCFRLNSKLVVSKLVVSQLRPADLFFCSWGNDTPAFV
jgi:hypothetical protein